jgi:hypothetical protein
MSDDDFLIIRELTVGDIIRRQNEITNLLEFIDPMSNDFLDLMNESSLLMKRMMDFQVSYNEKFNDSIK